MPDGLTPYPSPQNTESPPYSEIPNQLNLGAGTEYPPPPGPPLHQPLSASHVTTTDTAYTFSEPIRNGFLPDSLQLCDPNHTSTEYPVPSAVRRARHCFSTPVVKARQPSEPAYGHCTPSDIATPQSRYTSSSYHNTSPPSAGTRVSFQVRDRMTFASSSSLTLFVVGRSSRVPACTIYPPVSLEELRRNKMRPGCYRCDTFRAPIRPPWDQK